MTLAVRRNYAALAAVLGACVAPAMGVGLVLFDGESFETLGIGWMAAYSAAGGLGAALAAWLCWPRNTRRNRWRMVLAGIATVALAFVFVGFGLGVVALLDEWRRSGDVPDLRIVPGMIGATFALGSVMTLGLPYLVGALASLPFADGASA